MNHTIEGSKGCQVVCIGWHEKNIINENEKGFTAERNAKKDGKELDILNIQEIKVHSSRLFENNKLESENGKIIDSFGDFKELKNINSKRVTEHAIKLRESENEI